MVTALSTGRPLSIVTVQPPMVAAVSSQTTVPPAPVKAKNIGWIVAPIFIAVETSPSTKPQIIAVKSGPVNTNSTLYPMYQTANQ